MPRARVVAVVGGSSGIGYASALRFAADGDQLVLLSRSAEALADARAACLAAGARSVLTLDVDVADSDAVESAVQRMVAEYARIDVVVHAAAVMAYGEIQAVPREVFERVVATVVFGTRNVATAVLPVMRLQHAGTLIVVNSLLGGVAVPKMGAYVTAKWAQRGFVRTLQQEVRSDRGVRVCLVTPGSINTPIYDQGGNFVGRRPRPPWPVTSPERVAAVIAQLAEHPRDRVSARVGPANPLIVTGFRSLPFVFDRIVTRVFRFVGLTRERAAPTTGNVHQPVPAGERVHGRWPDRPT